MQWFWTLWYYPGDFGRLQHGFLVSDFLYLFLSLTFHEHSHFSNLQAAARQTIQEHKCNFAYADLEQNNSTILNGLKCLSFFCALDLHKKAFHRLAFVCVFKSVSLSQNHMLTHEINSFLFSRNTKNVKFLGNIIQMILELWKDYGLRNPS